MVLIWQKFIADHGVWWGRIDLSSLEWDSPGQVEVTLNKVKFIRDLGANHSSHPPPPPFLSIKYSHYLFSLIDVAGIYLQGVCVFCVTHENWFLMLALFVDIQCEVVCKSLNWARQIEFAIGFCHLCHIEWLEVSHWSNINYVFIKGCGTYIFLS